MYGKSTLLKLIFNEILVEDYVEYTGEIIKDKAKLGYLAQELEEKDKELSIYEFMCQEEAFFAASPKELAGICNQMSISVEIRILILIAVTIWDITYSYGYIFR